MKKSCNGCKALTTSGCSLNYKTKGEIKLIMGWPITIYKPIEQCPKPKTIKAYIEEYYKSRIGGKRNDK